MEPCRRREASDPLSKIRADEVKDGLPGPLRDTVPVVACVSRVKLVGDVLDVVFPGAAAPPVEEDSVGEPRLRHEGEHDEGGDWYKKLLPY